MTSVIQPEYEQQSVVLPHVTDGWSYNTTMDFLPGWAGPHLLAAMGPLRRGANYRPRFYVAPDGLCGGGGGNALNPIPPYQTFIREIHITPGAWIWGYAVVVSPVVVNVPAGFARTGALDVSVKVTEVSTGIPLFEEFSVGSLAAFTSGTAIQAFGSVPFNIVLLTEPRPVADPGEFLVEIANRVGQSYTDPGDGALAPKVYSVPAQVLICTSEPCRTVDQSLPAGPIVR